MLKGGLLVRSFSRAYTIPRLESLSQSNGLPGLLSPEGLKNAWFDRAELFVKKLNVLTAQTDQLPLETIIHDSAKSLTKREIWNYASLLYNLKFSMSGLHECSSLLPTKATRKDLLKTPELSLKYENEPLSTGNETLHQALIQSFGSIIEFRSLLLNSNKAISGDGFTWLVARKVKGLEISNSIHFDKLFILNTYNAGSPFNANKVGYMKQMESKIDGTKSTDSYKSAGDSLVYRDISYIPLLAIDSSPKVWLHDYGVFGKDKYLERVWEGINWDIVQSRLPIKYEDTLFRI